MMDETQPAPVENKLAVWKSDIELRAMLREEVKKMKVTTWLLIGIGVIFVLGKIAARQT